MNELPHLRLITFLQSSHYLVDERELTDGQKQDNNGHTLGINIFGISCVAGTRGFCEMRFMSNKTEKNNMARVNDAVSPRMKMRLNQNHY